ncbi:MAG TPA: GAF domain-containing sensor histidine kinase [Gemmatimonadaceae bacterium]|nr:GAF domain-containing sensor histidine kinase [Gemmatimonadaceae bacterium]
MQTSLSTGVELDAAILQVAITLGVAVYALFLWRRYGKPYFASLAVACFLYVARLFAIISFLVTQRETWLYWHQVTTGWTALALLWTALAFSRQVRFRPAYSVALLFPVAWSYVAIYVLENFLWAVLPAVLFLSAVTAWTGWIFFDYWRTTRSPGAGLLATSLLLWAIHHLDYPFLRARGAWSPWGYYLDVVLLLATICGITILVLDDLRGGMRALTSLAASTASPGKATAGLLDQAVALPAVRAAALYRLDGDRPTFTGGAGTASGWASLPLPAPASSALAGAMTSGQPVVRPDWIAPDGTAYAYTAILPLACHVATPQVLVVAGDTRDPFAALDASFLVSLGMQLAAALDAAELLARLQERTEALGRLSSRVVRHDEDERRRLSRELHDETAQVFSALKLQLGLLQERAEPTAAEGLGRALGLLDEGMRSIRSVTETLRPAVLDELGLLPALRSLINDFAKRSSIAVTADLPDGDWRLGTDVELALYRSLQESLTNAMRHSNATRVHVSLARAGGEVTLTVRDDGVGVASQASLVMLEHNGRRGLGGMHDRVAALGGSFDVSMPGSRGLQVSVRLPEGAR